MRACCSFFPFLVLVGCSGGGPAPDVDDSGDSGQGWGGDSGSGNGGNGGNGGDSGSPSEVDPDPPVLDWQVLHGGPSGVEELHEGVMGLAADGGGGFVAWLDRRWRDDREDTREFVALAVDVDGLVPMPRRFTFDDDLRALAFALAPDDDLVAVFGQDPIVARLQADGALWTRRLTLGGASSPDFHANDVGVDAQGAVYVTGEFESPHHGEPSGYLLKLAADGTPLWLRSWITLPTEAEQQVAVADGTVFVMDTTPGPSDFSEVRRLFAFAPDGTLRAQTALRIQGGPAVMAAGIVADGPRVALIGSRITGSRGAYALLVAHVVLDGDLALVSRSGSEVAYGDVDASPLHVSRAPDGGLLAAASLGEHFGLFRLGAGETVVSAYDLVREDDSSPAVLEDRPIRVAHLAGGRAVVGVTAEAPGTFSLVPRSSTSAAVPLELDTTGVEVATETLAGVDAGLTVTVGVDPDGVEDDPATGDQDGLLFGVTF